MQPRRFRHLPVAAGEEPRAGARRARALHIQVAGAEDGDTMLRLALTKKTIVAHPASFYCRMHNRLVGGCPRAQGPGGCPLLRECPADAVHSVAAAAASTDPATRH